MKSHWLKWNPVAEGADRLEYEIRAIVQTAREIGAMGRRSMVWENIGDPIKKGEKLADWILEILCRLAADSASWSYCDTAGVLETREFLAALASARPGGLALTPEEIMFFCGVGDAVAMVYSLLRREARVLGPSPAYPTHSSAEAASSGYWPVTYNLDPLSGWLPDVEQIRSIVKHNDTIAGILVLSPDNPTGAVYPREILEQIAEIARRNRLFIITDEIYRNVVYNGQPRLSASQWIGDVPALVMGGISKDYPCPGARCGWIEVYNKHKDERFAAYADSILAAKRLQVSATTVPQLSIPLVMGHKNWPAHLKRREAMFEARADQAMAAFAGCESVIVNKPGGAFYFTPVFRPGVLNDHQVLPIGNAQIRTRIEELVSDVTPDKRFVYYLMGATGIVVVPLTGFQSDLPGFRMTLLETDDDKRAWTLETLRESIDAYVNS
jgi:aspartate/methionine/tyrosine aminotransferase